MMRSLLFTPGDSLRKMERSATSAADARDPRARRRFGRRNRTSRLRAISSATISRSIQSACGKSSVCGSVPLSSPQRLLDALQSVPSRPEEAEMTDLIATNEATTTGEAFERGVSIYSARHQTREAGSTAAFEKQPTVRNLPMTHGNHPTTAFGLNEEQRAILDQADRFARNELHPSHKGWTTRNGGRRMPSSDWR